MSSLEPRCDSWLRSRPYTEVLTRPRALIGFHDGLSNLDPSHSDDDAKLVFIRPDSPAYPPTPPAGPQSPASPGQPGYGNPQAGGPIFPDLRQPPTPEPASATGGTYLFVRASLFDMHTWDNQTLTQQEQAVGRHKLSGATLDRSNDSTERDLPPIYETDPTNVTVPPTSHIRRANPRAVPDDRLRRIFRRGYPLITSTSTGSPGRGLLFASFSRSLSTQVEFMFRAWLRNKDFPTPGAGPDPLMALDNNVLAGGYYFIPPLTDTRKPWTWNLPLA